MSSSISTTSTILYFKRFVNRYVSHKYISANRYSIRTQLNPQNALTGVHKHCRRALVFLNNVRGSHATQRIKLRRMKSLLSPACAIRNSNPEARLEAILSRGANLTMVVVLNTSFWAAVERIVAEIKAEQCGAPATLPSAVVRNNIFGLNLRKEGLSARKSLMESTER